jgi:hypothetical protein
VLGAACVDWLPEACTFKMLAGAAGWRDVTAGRVADGGRVWLPTVAVERREETGEGVATAAETGVSDAWRIGPVVAGTGASRVPDIVAEAIAEASGEGSSACPAGASSGTRMNDCHLLSWASSDTAISSNTSSIPVRSMERRGLPDEPTWSVAPSTPDSIRLPFAPGSSGAEADGFT